MRDTTWCNHGPVAMVGRMTAMTLRIPDEINASIKAGAAAAGLSLNAYIVRAAQRQAVLDSARRLASLGLGDDLGGEGDTL